ncbi:hypothetical protein HY631_00690 [Candidatus Uhrbacteria bacterium]|nr:hypothetical protein [Candidatus Uhrbacteria bacterium]
MKNLDKVIFAALAVLGVVILRITLVTDPDIGIGITYTTALVCLAYFCSLVESNDQEREAPPRAESDEEDAQRSLS